MKTEYKISIENITIDELISNPSILLEKITPPAKLDFENYILDNQSNKDGSPSISNLHVKNFSYDQAKNTGNFRLKFNIDRIYCCSDVEASKSDYVDFNFAVEKNTIFAETAYFVWELNN